MFLLFLSSLLFYFHHNDKISEKKFPIIEISQKSDEKNIFIISEKFATENPILNMKKLSDGWRSDKIFSCDNFSVFGLDGDVSMIENSKTQFFFAENMLNGDFYDCENKKLAKYSFLDFGNRKVFLEKINFYENFYFSEICEGEYNEFQKYFSGKNGEKNSGNLENCEKIFKKYQNLTKNL